MKVIKTAAELGSFLSEVRSCGKSVGFVPTMGFLHQGHLSLIEASGKENDLTVVSIFVNPAQFNDLADFEKYPRDMERDLNLLSETSVVDVCFLPEVEEMFRAEMRVEMAAPKLTNCLCGVSRPGHFAGVLVVVSKLFNMVKPDRAYFGQKDFQQCVLIRALIEDLNYGIEMKILSTVRDEEGLALSSRNSRLSSFGLDKARRFAQILCSVESMVAGGETRADFLVAELKRQISEIEGVGIDYLEFRSGIDLAEVEMVEEGVVILGAVVIEGVRLIDNYVL